jgi:hypothetical protein
VRSYSVAVVSLAIGAPAKWTDNLIAHHDIPDVRSRARGVARGVAWAAVVRIAVIRELHIALGCGVREAVALSDALLREPVSQVSVGRWSTLGLDRRALEHDVQLRLAEVLESAPQPRRGRPVRRVAHRETREG